MSEVDLGAAVERAARALADASTDAALAVRHDLEGWVVSAADGVARIHGLPSVALGELIAVGREPALVVAIERGAAQAVVLGDARRVRERDRARRLAERPTIQVSEALLGRVIDPLGRPLDGAPLLPATWARVPLERPAPGIAARAAVHRPLQTGVLAIDAMLPIGCGQRELVLGDEGTGKTTLVTDILIRQRDTGVVGIYAAIGHRRAEIWRLVSLLAERGGRWIVVAAPHDAPPGLRYLAPFSAMAVGEYFMDRGEHALVVLDDLTAHASAWREIALLLRMAPGREAFPGDIFYLHSRLLERATQLAPERGGGSLTALPVAVTESGRLSAYIPTNLVSITDGQIVLSSAAFARGQKPAIDVGLSVSRVGGRAQSHALRALSARLKLDFAAYLELEAFARLGTGLEEGARRRLAVGERIQGLMRSPERAPLSTFDEVVLLLVATTHDLLLALPKRDVEIAEAARGFAARLCERHPEIAARVERDLVLTDADRATLVESLWTFVSSRPAPTP
ncbi:MAG: F0F1 ATP synthase subunit alpha [Deltaproteobacteria bacterium]|nr:F0F1 ATP synthase subunit alpha [Deltaproteobacteria bacterium]